MKPLSDQLIDKKPLKQLDEMYPGYHFMELDNKMSGLRTIVGTRKSISGEALYSERVISGDAMLEAEAMQIIDDLNRVAAKREWRGHDKIVGYMTPRQYSKLLADEKEAEEVL